MSEAFILVDHMGLHILSHGEGYKEVLQAKQTLRLLTDISQSTIDAVQVELR